MSKIAVQKECNNVKIKCNSYYLAYDIYHIDLKYFLIYKVHKLKNWDLSNYKKHITTAPCAWAFCSHYSHNTFIVIVPLFKKRSNMVYCSLSFDMPKTCLMSQPGKLFNITLEMHQYFFVTLQMLYLMNLPAITSFSCFQCKIDFCASGKR